MAGLGVALFSVLDAMMKEISISYPLAQSTGMRYFAGAIFAILYYSFSATQLPSRSAIVRSIPRTLANLIAGACFFLAISRLPLMDAVALTFLSPLFLAIWGCIFLREYVTKRTLIAIMIGLIGVFVIAQGQSINVQRSFDLLGFLAAISTAILYALSMVMTRSHSGKDALPTLVLLPSVLGTAFSAGPMIWVWQPVLLWHYLLLACVGLIGTFAYICLAWAYANSNVGRLGLLEYTGLIWGAFFGYFFFYEVPSVWTVVGAAMIIGACLPAFSKGVVEPS